MGYYPTLYSNVESCVKYLHKLGISPSSKSAEPYAPQAKSAEPYALRRTCIFVCMCVCVCFRMCVCVDGIWLACKDAVRVPAWFNHTGVPKTKERTCFPQFVPMKRSLP